MRITNDLNLPAPLIAAVSKTRQPVAGQISVTELIGPPQIRALIIKHWDEITEDASERLWAAVGSLMHQMLESHADIPRHQAERTLSTVVEGFNVTGTFDLYYEEGVLTDYKFVSVWTTMNGVKDEWEQQLNLYAHLLKLAGARVETIQIVAIYRDWTKSKAFDSNYPSTQVQTFAVPLWTSEAAESFLSERVRLHMKAEAGEVPPCTPDERWERPTRHAVMKRGQKRAVRVFDTYEEAEVNLTKAGLYVEERKGASVRCESYCRVASFCPQYASMREEQSASDNDSLN
jgi:hypothetical protein